MRNVIPMSLIATCRAGAASRAQAAFLASLTLADVAANAFAIGAVQNSVDVEEAVEFGPHIRCVGRAAYIGDLTLTRFGGLVVRPLRLLVG